MTIEVSTHSDRRFRALIEHSIDAIALLTPEGTVTYASPSIERVLGYTPQEFLTINGFDVIHPGDIPSIAHTFQHLLATPELVDTKQFRGRHKDGAWRWVEATMTNLLHDPDVQAIVTTLHEITERRNLEQQLQYSEQKLRSLVKSNILGVIVADLDGRVYEINDRFAQILGYSRDELLAETFNWGQLIPPEAHEALEQVMTTVLSTGALPPLEWESLRKDGSRVQVLMAATLLDQEPRLGLGVILDISDRKAAERRKQEFLSMVSHELRTPLTAILGLIELALMQIDLRPRSLSPEAEGLLGQIEKVLQQASGQVEIETRLVEELLEVSRLEMHKFELSLQRENLVMIVQEAVANQRRAARTRQIELVLLPDEVVPVIADATRIEQVLTNYLTNALKYAPADQVVSVRLEIAGTIARVSVRDQGPGLTSEQQQRVWERFYQAAVPGCQGADGGLGLGLAIAKVIIEQHQGQVGVESAPGQGSTFWFTMPLANGLITNVEKLFLG
jgi:PAS domain S-box-containing protein